MPAGQGQVIASLFARIGADISDLQAGMKEVRAELEKSNKGFDQFGLKNVLNIGKVTAALFAMKKGFDFAKEGAMLSRLNLAGDQLAASFGANMDTIISKLDAAAHGTVSNTDLMLSANRALMLGVTKDADQMANLLEVAALRGRAMGLSTTQAFNDIVTGIGRMSPLILDNLGIVTNLDARVKEWAASNGVAAEKVDDATKRQILLNAVLDEGNKMLARTGGLLDDTATTYERFGAQGEDAFNRLKKATGEFFEPLVDSLADGLEGYNDLNDALEATGVQQVAVVGTGGKLIKYFVDSNGLVITSNELFMRYNAILGAAGLTLASDFIPKVLKGGSAVAGLNVNLAELDGTGAASALSSVGSAAEAADEKLSAFMDTASRDPFSDLLDVSKATEFYRLGGQAITDFSDLVQQEMADAGGVIDEQLAGKIQASALAGAALNVAMGEIDAKDAVAELEKLPVPIEDAYSKLMATVGLLTAADGMRASMFLDVDTSLPIGLLQDLLGLTRGQTADALRWQGLAGTNPKKPKGPAKGGLMGAAGWGSDGGVFAIGEQGEEGVIPLGNGKYWVVPHNEWEKMKKSGLLPTDGFASGGLLPITGPYEPPSSPTNGSRNPNAGAARHAYSARYNGLASQYGFIATGLKKDQSQAAYSARLSGLAGISSGGGGGRKVDQAPTQLARQVAVQAASGVGASVAAAAQRQSVAAIEAFAAANKLNATMSLGKQDELISAVKQLATKQDIKSAVREAVNEVR